MRARARRVLVAVGAETLPDPGSSAAAAAAPVAPASAAAEPDLMGDLLGAEDAAAEARQEASPALTTAPAAQPPAPAGNDLLGAQLRLRAAVAWPCTSGSSDRTVSLGC